MVILRFIMQSQNLINSSWRPAFGELEHWKLAGSVLLLSVGVAVLVNVMRQVLFKRKDELPVVFHLVPILIKRSLEGHS